MFRQWLFYILTLNCQCKKTSWWGRKLEEEVDCSPAPLHHSIGIYLIAITIELYFLNFIEAQLIYKVVLVSTAQQSDLVIHIYILCHILFHYGLSKDIEYSSLCYTIGLSSLSILYIIVCIGQSQTPSPPPLPRHNPFCNHKYFSYVCKSVSVFGYVDWCWVFFLFFF